MKKDIPARSLYRIGLLMPLLSVCLSKCGTPTGAGRHQFSDEIPPAVQAAPAFSPDGDGIDDTWIIRNMENYPQAEVYVYNRYGFLMYRHKGSYTPWNGNNKAGEVPEGSYYYIIIPYKKAKRTDGWLTIQRITKKT